MASPPGTPSPTEDVPPADPLHPRPGYDWRGAVAVVSGLAVLAGVWLVVAPFVLGYAAGDPTPNDIVCGVVIGTLGLAQVTGAYRATWLSWATAALGVWLFVAALWIDDSGQAVGNDIVAGVVVFALGVAGARASQGAGAEPATGAER